MVFAAAVMLLTTVPYLVGFAAQTEVWRFSGFLIGVEDGYSYLAKMGQGARGAWLFRLPYTSEPQSGAFVYSFYLVLGKLTGQNHTAQVIAFHLARVLCGGLALLASYRFLAEFVPHVTARRLGLALVALGGGLGWLMALLGQPRPLGSLPIEFFSPEAFTFLTIFTLPHLAASRALFLLGLWRHLRGDGVGAGLALSGVSLIQPLYVLVAWAVMGVDLVVGWLWKAQGDQGARWRSLLVAGLLSAPVVLYTIIAFSVDPVMRQWSAQNVLTSPSPLHYLLGYGPLLALALPGWRALQQTQPRLARFVLVWAPLVPLMIYAPISVQRRLIEGVQVPLVAVAMLGLTVALARWGRVLIPLVLIVSLPSSAILWLGGLNAARERLQPAFAPVDQLTVFAWLAQNAPADSVALAAFDTSNALPAYTPLIAYIGHGPETLHADVKVPQVEAFYRVDTADAERRRLLEDGRITYVLAGPPERALGDFDLDRAAYLTRVFEFKEYAVYEVVK